MQRFLLPQDLAEALGVGEAVVKRWGAEGRFQVLRTVGGVRRIALREALRFIRESASVVKDPMPLGIEKLPQFKTQSEGDAALEDAIYAGRAEDAWHLTLGMYVMGRKVEAICEGPITRAMYRVGPLWETGPGGIAHEHRATMVAAETLHLLKALLPQPVLGVGKALGGAMEADPYMLPSMMVSITLAALRWQEVNLGPNLPFAALMAAVDEHKPTLVWMSCSCPDLPPQRRAELEEVAIALEKRGIQMVAGGRGWREDVAAGIPHVKHVPTLAGLAAFVGSRAHS
jgi:methanogenic corrinoid protein MtbC1